MTNDQAKFLKKYGSTVLPELFPHMWKTPAPSRVVAAARNLIEGMLYFRWYDGGLLIPTVEVSEFIHRISSNSITVQSIGCAQPQLIPGLATFEVELSGQVNPTSHQLDEVFSKDRVVEFCIVRGDQFEQFKGHITDLATFYYNNTIPGVCVVVEGNKSDFTTTLLEEV